MKNDFPLHLSSYNIRLLMLQFLLTDYLPGYRLPSLRKTVTCHLTNLTCILTSKPNTYVVTSSVLNISGRVFVDSYHCITLAIRENRHSLLVGLLEDGTERVVGSRPYENPDGTIGDYLIEEE